MEALETLASFVAEGKVRYLGWSNVRTWRLERIRRLCLANGWRAPVALQREHSYLQPRAGLRNASIVDDEQLDYLESHPDLTLVAYSPVLKGLYDAAPEDRGAMWNYAPYAGDAARARLAAVDALAGELGVLPSQVVPCLDAGADVTADHPADRDNAGAPVRGVAGGAVHRAQPRAGGRARRRLTDVCSGHGRCG